MTGVLKYAERKYVGKIGWQQIFDDKKMYSTIERMDCCEYSIELIIVPLKEHITRSNFFGNIHTTAEKITQAMDDCKFYCQNKYSTLQRMVDCYSFCDKNRILEWWNK